METKEMIFAWLGLLADLLRFFDHEVTDAIADEIESKLVMPL